MKMTGYSEPQILAILRQAEGGVPVAELCREHGMNSASFYIYRCLSDCKAIADLFRRQVPGCKQLSATPLDGAPKWEFRLVSLNKWSASAGHYKSQVSHTLEFAGRFISLIFLQSLLRA